MNRNTLIAIAAYYNHLGSGQIRVGQHVPDESDALPADQRDLVREDELLYSVGSQGLVMKNGRTDGGDLVFDIDPLHDGHVVVPDVCENPGGHRGWITIPIILGV